MQEKLKAAEGERDTLAMQAEALKQATDNEKLATDEKLAAAQEAEKAAASARQHLAEKQGMVSTTIYSIME